MALPERSDIYRFYILRFRNASRFRNTEHRTVGLNFFVRAREPSDEIILFPDYESSDGRIGGRQKTLVFINRRTREYERHNSSCAINYCTSISTMLVVPLIYIAKQFGDDNTMFLC